MGYSSRRKKTKRREVAVKGVVEDILFEPLPPRWIFLFITLPLEIPGKPKFHPWKFRKIVLHPLEIPQSISKTLGKCTWFLINSRKFCRLFLWYPWEFHILNPHCLEFFSGIAKYLERLLAFMLGWHIKNWPKKLLRI